ncbi:hypothetical protein [Lysinibacillus fusiformis]|uniref:hypothetical protein n=1 Tax=Lysinibacillus fusiformis TaxID=28031 RepID=UPI00215A8FE4|nr:hypothetical protein [Lysinibacillus fusiformis]MCR8852866.1 hypothetical protein [Lysinibacillus fusiformis]
MLKLTELYADYLIMIGKLIKGEMDLENYFKRRGINPKVKLNEVKILINMPMMFNLYISRVSIGVRCMIMKAVLDLNNRQIVDISFSMSRTYNSKTTIGDFINDHLLNSTDTNLNKKRTYSIELYYDLSIILDIPFRYIADAGTNYKMMGNFDEYDREKIKLYTFEQLVNEALIESKNIIGDGRKVLGVKIKNENFFPFELDLKTRVDIRDRYFTIEIHIENESSLDYVKILKLKNLIKKHCKIYIRNAFLRENKKLIFLIILDNSINPNISYLGSDLLVDNLLLMDDILCNYDNSLINRKFF